MTAAYIGLLACALSAATLPTSQARADNFHGICQSGLGKGAQVDDEKYCDFFQYYETNPNKILDTRIRDALGVSAARETRSIGLVISVSKYPKMHNSDLSSAAIDGEKLVHFLVNQQQFDEVIHLQDEKASESTIRYFIKKYLPARSADYSGKARVLITYSGHGRFANPTATALQPALVLSEAEDLDAVDGVYDMATFFADIKSLAGNDSELSRRHSPFHLLTLIFACFGGEFFGSGINGAPYNFREPGARALTAGNDKAEVPSLIPSRGSLFFDLIIDGITSGRADPQYFNTYIVDEGNGAVSHGLARFGALGGYLSATYDVIARNRKANHLEDVVIALPWDGATQDVARGGFFFLSDSGAPHTDLVKLYSTTNGRTTTAGSHCDSSDRCSAPTPTAPDTFHQELPPLREPTIATSQTTSRAQPLNIPAGPISALPGQPGVLIFKAPEIYPIHGFDVSSNDGYIDWMKLGKDVRPRFLYARAVGWSGQDETFANRRDGAKLIGADFGAYTKFDFCLNPGDQLKNLIGVASKADAMLPLAIEVVEPNGKDPTQAGCLNDKGLDREKNEILEFADNVQVSYGKTPIIFGNRSDLQKLTDRRSDKFMSWVEHYHAQMVKPGNNPWTLWGYASDLTVPGMGPNTSGVAFFGTERQYEAFKAGQDNVAQKAVTGGDIHQ